MAGIYQGNVWVFGDNPQPVTDGSTTHVYYDLVWSADGTKLAFVANDNPNGGGEDTVMLWDTHDKDKLAVPLYSSFFIHGLGFSSDSKEIMVIDYSTTLQSLTLRQIDAQAGAAVHDTNIPMPFTSGVECGGGPVNFAHAKYFDDKNEWRGMILSQTSAGWFFSGDCLIPGDYLINAETSVGITISENTKNTALSPDGTRIVGLSRIKGQNNYQPTLYNLQTKTSQVLETPVMPDLFAWSPDGQSIFYTHREPHGTIFGSLTADKQEHLKSLIDSAYLDDGTSYQSSLYRYDIASGNSTLLVLSYAYGFANLNVLPDAIIFSETENADNLLSMLANGSGTLPSENQYNIFKDLIQVHLMRLDFSTHQLEPLATGITQAAVNVPLVTSTP